MKLEPPDDWGDEEYEFIEQHWQDMDDLSIAEWLGEVPAGLITKVRLDHGWYNPGEEEFLRRRLGDSK